MVFNYSSHGYPVQRPEIQIVTNVLTDPRTFTVPCPKLHIMVKRLWNFTLWYIFYNFIYQLRRFPIFVHFIFVSKYNTNDFRNHCEYIFSLVILNSGFIPKVWFTYQFFILRVYCCYKMRRIPSLCCKFFAIGVNNSDFAWPEKIIRSPLSLKFFCYHNK